MKIDFGTYYTFINTVRSLSESTTVTLAYRNIKAVIRGRCSPYLSHRSVEYQYSEPTPLAAYNTVRAIVICKMSCELGWIESLKTTIASPKGEAEWRKIVVPKATVYPILKDASMFLGVDTAGYPDMLHVAFLKATISAIESAAEQEHKHLQEFDEDAYLFIPDEEDEE